MDLSLLGVLVGMVALGFRHGFDWDHIAAITDITSTTTAGHTEVDVPIGAQVTPHGHSAAEMRGGVHAHAHDPGAIHALRESRFAHEQRHAVALGTLYALGHASVVVVLGIAALVVGAILPAWVDPILQRVVGVTLVLLGVWVLFSVVQYLRGKGEFRMRSRWMLVFDLVRHGWGKLQARIHGHEHVPTTTHATQYGPKTAFGVGMIHGIGAETGSQALLIAGVAGVTGGTGIVFLLAFVVGLLASNTLVAVISASGFIGAQRTRMLYMVVGAVAGTASLVIGLIFIGGLGTVLPDLQELIFGAR